MENPEEWQKVEINDLKEQLKRLETIVHTQVGAPHMTAGVTQPQVGAVGPATEGSATASASGQRMNTEGSVLSTPTGAPVVMIPGPRKM